MKPKTWRVSELVAEQRLAVGDGYRAKNQELSREGIPFARAGNINDGFQFEGADYFPVRDLGKVGDKISRPGDVVFTSKGTVGRFAFVNAETARFVFAPQLCYWRSLDHDAVDPRWLYYWMNGPEFWEQASSVKGQTDMADYVSLGDQRRMTITLPQIDDQRQVATVLGSLDDKIEQNRRTGRKLEELARAVFKAWFVDFEPVKAKAAGATAFPGMPAETFASLPTTLKDSALGPVPEGWEVGRLSTLATVAIGGVWGDDTPSEGTVQAISLRGVDLEHLRETGFALPPVRWIKPGALAKRRLGETDVLIAGSGAGPTGRPLWAHSNVIDQWSVPVTYSNFCKRLSCTSTAAACFVDALLHEMRISREIWEHVNGTSIPNLDAASLMQRGLVVPSGAIMDAYHALVAPMVELRYSGESGKLAALRDYLLPRLLSGRVRVNDRVTNSSF